VTLNPFFQKNGSYISESARTSFENQGYIENLVFWNLFEFSAAEITLKAISPTF
jgi:hypothetical protein